MTAPSSSVRSPLDDARKAKLADLLEGLVKVRALPKSDAPGGVSGFHAAAAWVWRLVTNRRTGDDDSRFEGVLCPPERQIAVVMAPWLSVPGDVGDTVAEIVRIALSPPSVSAIDRVGDIDGQFRPRMWHDPFRCEDITVREMHLIARSHGYDVRFDERAIADIKDGELDLAQVPAGKRDDVVTIIAAWTPPALDDGWTLVMKRAAPRTDSPLAGYVRPRSDTPDAPTAA